MSEAWKLTEELIHNDKVVQKQKNLGIIEATSRLLRNVENEDGKLIYRITLEIFHLKTPRGYISNEELTKFIEVKTEGEINIIPSFRKMIFKYFFPELLKETTTNNPWDHFTTINNKRKTIGTYSTDAQELIEKLLNGANQTKSYENNSLEESIRQDMIMATGAIKKLKLLDGFLRLNTNDQLDLLKILLKEKN